MYVNITQKEGVVLCCAAGEVPRFPAYTTWAQRIAKQPRPAGNPLVPRNSKKGGKKGAGGNSSEGALVAAIKGKGQVGAAEVQAGHCEGGGVEGHEHCRSRAAYHNAVL
jgi:hypothetical protein